MPPYTVLAILGIFVTLALVVSHVEGLALFAPKKTARVRGAAQSFCLDQCRLADGGCPLAVAGMRREECPLWRFVDADLPTDLRVDPFRPVGV